jgi:hypothetical protein
MSLSPRQDPASWMRVVVGDFELPPGGRAAGTAILKPTSSQSPDKKKGAGKHKGKITQQGVDWTTGQIVVRFKEDWWAALEVVLSYLDPNGPYGGGPFAVDYPGIEFRKLKSIMIEKVHDVAWERGGFIGSVTLDWTEWEEPKKAAVGGATKTADSSKQWTGGGSVFSQDLRDSGAVKVKGPYEGDDAPNAKPKS